MPRLTAPGPLPTFESFVADRRALTLLASLPGERFNAEGLPDPRGTWARNPMHGRIGGVSRELGSFITQEIADAFGQTVTFDPAELLSEQKLVNLERVADYLLDPATTPHAATMSRGELPLAYFHRGYFLLLDGNHRCTGALLREESIEGRTVNLDALLLLARGQELPGEELPQTLQRLALARLAETTAA